MIFLVWGLFVIFSLYNSILDLKTLHISLVCNYFGFGVVFFIFLIFFKNRFLEYFLGALFLFCIFFVVRMITHQGLGLGDIHYSLFCGLVSGCPNFIISAFCASCLGIVYFVVCKYIIYKNKIEIKRIPFIPCMFLGTIIGNSICNIFL